LPQAEGKAKKEVRTKEVRSKKEEVKSEEGRSEDAAQAPQEVKSEK
jgi:hypothetical protein